MASKRFVTAGGVSASVVIAQAFAPHKDQHVGVFSGHPHRASYHAAGRGDVSNPVAQRQAFQAGLGALCGALPRLCQQ